MTNVAYKTISQVAEILNLPQHVLRFWEGKFEILKPHKSPGGHRLYSEQDIELLVGIRDLLYKEGYTIKGVQQLLASGVSSPQKLADAVLMRKALEDTPLDLDLKEPDAALSVEAAALERLDVIHSAVKKIKSLL